MQGNDIDIAVGPGIDLGEDGGEGAVGGPGGPLQRQVGVGEGE